MHFLGTTDQALRIAFVCDGDGSMMNIIANLKDALNQSVRDLQPDQRFNIILTGNGGLVPMDSKSLRPATATNKQAAKDYLDDYTMSGATDEAGAIALALKQRPQVIFLALSGDTPDNTRFLETIRQLNASHQTRIHTIRVCNFAAYSEDEGFPQLMQQIATENAGTCHAVDLSLWTPAVAQSFSRAWGLLVVGLLPLVVVVPMVRLRLLRRRRRASGQCMICGYDVRATPRRCPECGGGGGDCLQPGKQQTGQGMDFTHHVLVLVNDFPAPYMILLSAVLRLPAQLLRLQKVLTRLRTCRACKHEPECAGAVDTKRYQPP